MKTSKVFICVALLLFAGCTSTANLFKKISGENHESAQVYVTGTVDTLSLVTNRTEEIELAASLAGSAQEIEGLPPTGKRLDVKGILDKDGGSLQVLADRRSQDGINAVKLRELEARLLALGEEKEKENNANFWSKLKFRFGFWGAILVLVGGTIALLIFCPPAGILAVKLIGMAVNGLVSMIPSLMNSVTVVSKAAFENVVQGVGNVRDQMKDDPKKTYTGEEVLNLINAELRVSTDRSDKVLIENVRKKLDV